MAYDLELAERVRDLVADEPGLTEQAMFGGLAFLVNGNMAVAVSGQGGLMVRVDPAADLFGEPGVAPMVMRGREMSGWLRVAAEQVAADAALQTWVGRGVGYARGLRPK